MSKELLNFVLALPETPWDEIHEWIMSLPPDMPAREAWSLIPRGAWIAWIGWHAGVDGSAFDMWRHSAPESADAARSVILWDMVVAARKECST